jgi:hypothetical protein
MEDPQSNAARLVAYTEGRDPVAMQAETAGVLADLIAGIPDAVLRQRPRPDKWSVGEILAHLAEDELATGWRYRQMIEHGGCPLASFDQDLWARLGDYGAWDPAAALDLFRLLREANLRLLRRLTPEQWRCQGIHAERGPLSIADLARHMAGHDRNHLDQIRERLGEPGPERWPTGSAADAGARPGARVNSSQRD